MVGKRHFWCCRRPFFCCCPFCFCCVFCYWQPCCFPCSPVPGIPAVTCLPGVTNAPAFIGIHAVVDISAVARILLLLTFLLFLVFVDVLSVVGATAVADIPAVFSIHAGVGFSVLPIVLLLLAYFLLLASVFSLYLLPFVSLRFIYVSLTFGLFLFHAKLAKKCCGWQWICRRVTGRLVYTIQYSTRHSVIVPLNIRNVQIRHILYLSLILSARYILAVTWCFFYLLVNYSFFKGVR